MDDHIITMRFHTFIKADDLNELIKGKHPLVIIDSRFVLTNPDDGYESYTQAHIPGAVYAHLENDISSAVSEFSGRHPLPKLSEFKQWLIENGIDWNKQIVVYDDMNGGIAARLWFMLIQISYPNVAVLMGGYREWSYLYPVISGVEKNSPLTHLELPKSWEKGTYKLYDLSIDELGGLIIVDSRSAERYNGENEPFDPIAGHIPGALNHFWGSNLDENGNLLLVDNLLKQFSGYFESDKSTVFYCGSGVTACFNILVSAHLGLARPGLYVGSWSHWIKHRSNEIDTKSDNY